MGGVGARNLWGMPAWTGVPYRPARQTQSPRGVTGRAAHRVKTGAFSRLGQKRFVCYDAVAWSLKASTAFVCITPWLLLENVMPTLEWIGKKAVVNHHREVPFHLLRCDPDRSVGEPGSGNMLIQGDNLKALKALLPYYAGKVKCIYIDPPYNTGNEGWIYNDAVNGPEMRDWLGKVVGKEAEDLSRHDKWLCMMYPRLAILHKLLAEDGVIFVSIDENEVQHLRKILDEIFGTNNFISTVIWQKVYSPKNSAKHFSEDHDFILVFAKSKEKWMPNLLSRSDKQDKAYKNPDNDPRGPWMSDNISSRNYYSEGTYPIACPGGRIILSPPTGSYWRFSQTKFNELNQENRIYWGKTGNNTPRLKRFLSDVMNGRVPQTLWFYAEVGHTQEAKKELVSICDFADSAAVFITPKPRRLIKRILEIATNKDSLILDSFAGSGTTGHAVLDLNAEDGGNRQFILVEMEQNICQNITAIRLQRAIEGYTPNTGKKQPVPGLGGGFCYCTLGEPLFDQNGRVNKVVTFPELAAHTYFIETGEPLPTPQAKSPLLGVRDGIAIYLLFNGILGDKTINGGNVLTGPVLAALPPHDGPKVIYGAGCRFSPARLRRENIIFKQVPYQVKVD